MSEWLIPLLGLGSKLFIYLGIATISGGWFVAALSKNQPGFIILIHRYMLVGVMVALVATGINFYAQVGSFAEDGWTGMFDATYVSMLWDSAVGNSVAIRVLALGSLLIMLIVLMQSRKFSVSAMQYGSMVWVTIIGCVFVVALAATFTLIGHTTALPVLMRLLLSIHVSIALLWMGSLLPLWWACRVFEVHQLQDLMQRFGVIAMGFVTVLLVCGLVVAYQLLGSITELVTTPYGRMLLAKVALVAVILGFAAVHKWRLVPQLTNPQAVSRLERSIRLEALVGLGILIVTVLLTTVVGPESLHD